MKALVTDRRGIKKETPFWDRVDQPSIGCWAWQGGRISSGYGSFRRRSAHRVAWELTNGAIPDGLCVCHHCDNRGCVRPSHLFLGTNRDNMLDAARKGRMSRGERNGQARLTQADVLAILAEPRTPGRTLADQYGVSRGLIYEIRGGRRWGHLQAARP